MWADAPGPGRCWTSGMPAVRSTPRSTPSVCTRWGCDMRPLSRRRALQLGGLGVAGIVVGSTGLAWAGTTRYDPVAGENLTAPAILTSTTGNLTLTLEAAAGRGALAGRDATTLRYNGSVPGPTLHLRPGDHPGSGSRREFRPPAPTDPGVTVAGHRALVILITRRREPISSA